MTDAAIQLSDLNERIQLAEGILEDRRTLLADLEKSGHDTTILREILRDTEGALRDLKAHRDRVAKPSHD
jgi:hypothetical protein